MGPRDLRCEEGERRNIQRRVNEATEKVNLHPSGQEGCSGEHRPVLRVVPVVMTYDNPPACRVIHGFEDICAQSLKTREPW